MSFYDRQILPRLIHVGCGKRSNARLRERVCAGLEGEVLEIGFGSGHNVAHYPGAVSRVAAVEPSDVAWKLGRGAVAESPVPVERSGLDGQRLPFGDDSFDSVLSTWTMCTIPDIAAALAEVHRVLRPGGSIHFVEHGIAPDASVRRWQTRLEPAQKRIFGGCHLTRDAPTLLEAADFEVAEVDRFYDEGAPKVLGADALGVARPTGTLTAR